MGIVERTRAIAPSAPADFDRFRLRRFVEGLGDELAVVSEPTELAAGQVGQFGVREHAHFAPIHLSRSRKVTGPEVTRDQPLRLIPVDQRVPCTLLIRTVPTGASDQRAPLVS